MTSFSTLGRAVALVCGVALALLAGTAPAQAVPIGPGCPALYIIGIQGTGQSSPTADPRADTGVVGALIGPVVAAVPGLVQRAYIPYGAGFGGAVPGGGTAPYADSVADAARLAMAAAAEVVAACPSTLLAGVGYSQGAQAMSVFAQQVGAGGGPVPADRIAAIVLYADPDRPADAATIPGRPGQTVPDPAPGTSGAAVSGVQLTAVSAGGSGIAADGASYGALTGRVASICVDGDLACSAPDHAALLRVGAQIAAQADLRDPLAALGSLSAVLSRALGDAWTTVVLNDFRVDGGSVDYVPAETLARRLIDASDPRIPAPTPADTAAAAARWGQITAAVANNLLGVVPRLVGELSAAWGQLLADDADLTNPAVWAHYANTIAVHNGYAVSGQLASGIAWLIAVAHDLAWRHP
ncbi:cutinase family protein [Nocardia terpenica]|uniref:cutinase family protein n=1 Tax=Nocardia terpenica TaxID=455432 RepID=UPI000AFAB76B|nr:cutinase family protein [Nocardia terpenica]